MGAFAMCRRSVFGMAVAAGMAMGVGGCGGNGVTVKNENPKGTVGGLVVDGVTLQPIDGVAVRILSAGGSFESTTGTDGFYKIPAVPSGGFTLELSKEGFLAVRIVSTLEGSVGNFPIASPIETVPPVGLVATGPDFVVRVVDTNGAAVAGVTATGRTTFSYVDLSSGTPRYVGGTVISTQTAADGRLVFKGLPNVATYGSLSGSYTYDALLGTISATDLVVSVAPLAVMGQDNYAYAGGTFRYSLVQLDGSLPQIVLGGPTDPLRVVESNVEWLKDGFTLPSFSLPVTGSTIPTAGPITIAFSEAVNPATLRAQVFTEAGLPGPALTPTVSLNLVALAPIAPFDAGHRYNLVLHADAALNPGSATRQRNADVPFFATPSAAAQPTVVSAKLTAGATSGTVQLVLSEPIGLGNGAAQNYPCVVFYEGVNLDGSVGGEPQVAGEWSADPSALSCNYTTSPVAGLFPQFIDSSLLTGTENKDAPAGQPVTGFTNIFTTTFSGYQMSGAMPAANSSTPVAGTKGHLYFSKLATTVRRVDGTPVTDIAFTLQ